MKTVLFVALAVIAAVSVVSAQGGPGSGERNKPPSECMARKGKVKKPKDCCNGIDLIPESDLAECEAEFPKSDSQDKQGPGGPGRRFCVMDCYFNKTGIFSDGQAVKSVALDILGRTTDEEMTKLLNEAIDKCIQVQKNHQEKMQERRNSRPNHPMGPPPDDMDKNRCRPSAHMFYMCVQISMYKACPADKLVSSDECTEFKQFTDKCIPAL